MSRESDLKANEFLAVSHKFRLGALPTETPHPDTGNLSRLAQTDLKRGYETLRKIDVEIFDVVRKQLPLLEAMSRDMHDTLAKGNRVFLSGCGATGRLSLSLEYFWRTLKPKYPDGVIAFMAGGDNALIKSIERFEDRPDFAHRTMADLGFRSGDMMVAITEGGETPFVIGSVNQAVEVSPAARHYFLYCNPDESLMGIERSREVIENPAITKINLFCGPMGLSGSTRMQASTVQMFAAGLALLCPVTGRGMAEELDATQAAVRDTDYPRVAEFTRAEAEIYRQGDFLLYETNEYGITLLTDSTERSPTFSLKPFENRLAPNPTPGWCYLCLPESCGRRNPGAPMDPASASTEDSRAAWEKLLARKPRPLNWEGLPEVSLETLLGFDFSASVREFREKLVAPHRLHTFRVWKAGPRMTFALGGRELSFDVGGLSLLAEHTLLKIILNTHSTLLMGILGRYEENLMVWVRPSNLKLIDRCIRYIRILLERQGATAGYEETAHHLFAQMETTRDDEPIVVETVERILKAKGAKSQGRGEAR